LSPLIRKLAVSFHTVLSSFLGGIQFSLLASARDPLAPGCARCATLHQILWPFAVVSFFGGAIMLIQRLRAHAVCLFLHPLLLSLAILGVSLAGYAHAGQVSGIYQAKVPVQAQTQAARDAAFKAALETVLIKATGDRAIMNRPAAKDLQASASRYVQQYGYREIAPMMIWIKFDGAALQAALTQAGLPIWDDERPAVLIWLAVQQQNHRYLIGEDSRGSAYHIIHTVATERGLPILLPLLDLEDSSKISAADVLGGFDEAVTEASARYGADAVVMAAMAGFKRNWRAEWRLSYGGQRLNWNFDGASLGAVLTKGMQAVADSLGQRLAVVESVRAHRGLQIRVEEVNTLEDYAKIQRYLDNISLVQDSRLNLAAPGYVVFWARLNGNPADLMRVIALGDVVEAAPPPERLIAKPGVSNIRHQAPALHFRLLP
jgi:uncharacterized protein